VLAVHEADSAALRMKENLSALSSLHSRYVEEWQSLSADTESKALEARSLGYIADGEIIIRLLTENKDPVPPSAGERISYEPSVQLTESGIKQIALVSSLITALFGMLMHILNSRDHRQRETLVQEASRT